MVPDIVNDPFDCWFLMSNIGLYQGCVNLTILPAYPLRGPSRIYGYKFRPVLAGPQ